MAAALPLPDSGGFADLPLAELLVRLDARRFSGTVELAAGNRSHLAVFVDGRPAKLRLGAPVDQLGRILVERGLLTSERLNEALDLQKLDGGLLGAIVVRAGWVAEDALEGALGEQIRRRFLRLFLAAEGSYRLHHGQDLLEGTGGTGTPVDALGFLAEALRTAAAFDDLEARLARALAGRVAVLALGPTIERLRFAPDEESACRFLARGPWDASVFRRLPAEHRGLALVVAYCLLLTDQIGFAEAGAAPPPGSPVGVGVGVGVGAGPGDEPPAAAPPAAPAGAGTPAEPPGAAPDAALAALRADIEDLHAHLDERDHFELLGVTESTPPETVKEQYLALVQRYHPDRAARHGVEDLRGKLEEILVRIREAHDTLVDADARRRYLAQRGGKPDAEAEAQGVVERALAAERAYQMAVVLERQHRVDEAADAAREALRLAPEQGEYICMVRWLEALRRPARAAVDDLVTSTLQAATSAAKHERAQMQAARLLQRAGRQGEALEYFRKVLALNPQNVDAAREVRLAQMREEKKAAAPAGLFGRLFRKKDG